MSTKVYQINDELVHAACAGTLPEDAKEILATDLEADEVCNVCNEPLAVVDDEDEFDIVEDEEETA